MFCDRCRAMCGDDCGVRFGPADWMCHPGVRSYFSGRIWPPSGLHANTDAVCGRSSQYKQGFIVSQRGSRAMWLDTARLRAAVVGFAQGECANSVGGAGDGRAHWCWRALCLTSARRELAAPSNRRRSRWLWVLRRRQVCRRASVRPLCWCRNSRRRPWFVRR